MNESDTFNKLKSITFEEAKIIYYNTACEYNDDYFDLHQVTDTRLKEHGRSMTKLLTEIYGS
jgi:hypothetical protein